MAQPIAFEVWLIICIAPCIISWGLGRAHGAWRARNLIGEGTFQFGGSEETVMFTAPLIANRRARDPAAPVGRQSAINTGFLKPAEPKPAPCTAFSAMPTLRDLRDRAEVMRREKASKRYGVMAEVLADDQIAATKAIEDYRHAIAALHQANRRRSPVFYQTLDEGLIIEMMPRIADVAPVSPSAHMSDFVARRETREIPLMPAY